MADDNDISETPVEGSRPGPVLGASSADTTATAVSNNVRSLAKMFEQSGGIGEVRRQEKAKVDRTENAGIYNKQQKQELSSVVTEEKVKSHSETCKKKQTDTRSEVSLRNDDCEMVKEISLIPQVSRKYDSKKKKKLAKLGRRRHEMNGNSEETKAEKQTWVSGDDSVDGVAQDTGGVDVEGSSCDELEPTDGSYIRLTEAKDECDIDDTADGKVESSPNRGQDSSPSVPDCFKGSGTKLKRFADDGVAPSPRTQEGRGSVVKKRHSSVTEATASGGRERSSSFEPRENRKVEIFISPAEKNKYSSPADTVSSRTDSPKKAALARPHVSSPPPPPSPSNVDRPLPAPPSCPGESDSRPPTPPPVETIPKRKQFPPSASTNLTENFYITPPNVPSHLPPPLPPRPPELLRPHVEGEVHTHRVGKISPSGKWEIFRKKNLKRGKLQIKQSSSHPDLLALDSSDYEKRGGEHGARKRLSMSPMMPSGSAADNDDDDDDPPPPPPRRDSSLTHRITPLTRIAGLPFRELPQPPNAINKIPSKIDPPNRTVAMTPVTSQKVPYSPSELSSSEDDEDDNEDDVSAEAPELWKEAMETAQLNFTAALSRYAKNNDSVVVDDNATVTENSVVTTTSSESTTTTSSESTTTTTSSESTTTTTAAEYEIPHQSEDEMDEEENIYETTKTLREQTFKFVSAEPLYQMYTSDLTRRQTVVKRPSIPASKEVEEEEESPAMTVPSDVSSPVSGPIPVEGLLQRTLWCHLPDVRNSGLLETLTDKEKKIQEAIFEVVTSEASYLRSLDVLVDHFMKSVEFSRCELIFCRKTLFSCVEGVREVSERFISVLEKRQSDNIMMSDVCDIVEDFACNHFNVYIEYCTYQVYQVKMLKSLIDTNVDFVNAKRRLESSNVCQGLTLHSFLMLPMQRITRLPLLVDAIAHRLDSDADMYESTSRAAKAIHKVVSACNEGARKMERLEQSCRIQKQLRFKTPPISVVMENRYLIKEGVLSHIVVGDSKFTKSRKMLKRHLYLYLFSDLLLISKKRKGYFEVIDYCKRTFLTVDHITGVLENQHFPNGPPPGCKNIFMVVLLQNHQQKNIELILTAKSPSEKTRWMESMMPPTSSVDGESIYDSWDCPQVQVIYPYTAQQPDELTLDESDIINVLRKIDDGWWEGERIRDCEKGWFPVNHTEEILSQHVRARNLRQRYRLLAASAQLRKSNQMSGKKKKSFSRFL